MAVAQLTEQDVQTALKALTDPNTKTDYVTGKSAKNIKVESNNVAVDILLGYPGKSQIEPIRKAVADQLKTLPGVGSVTVNVSIKIVSHAVQRGVKLIPGRGLLPVVAQSRNLGPVEHRPAFHRRLHALPR